MADRTVVEVDYGTSITWPAAPTDAIFDSKLAINLGIVFNAVSPFDVMGDEGTNEIFRIIDEEKQSFRDKGFSDAYIEWETSEPLVKKPPEPIT